MDYLIISITLLAIGIYGLLAKRNLLKTLISIELITAAASMNFIFLASGAALGQVFLILTLSTDSCITAIILAVLVVIARKYGTWDLRTITNIEDGEDEQQSSEPEGVKGDL